jgi:hypothetical protein
MPPVEEANALAAPLCVPVELRSAPRGPKNDSDRWFRIANEVAENGLVLGNALPEELGGAIAVRFHLPGDAQAIEVTARGAEVRVGRGEEEHAERRALYFSAVDEPARTRIAGYVLDRLGLT